MYVVGGVHMSHTGLTPPIGGLPPEIWSLVHAHGAAMQIQRAVRRYFLLRHARRPGWGALRGHLIRMGAWHRLRPFAVVRREWRTEPASWGGVLATGVLAAEAETGLWGHRGRYGL